MTIREVIEVEYNPMLVSLMCCINMSSLALELREQLICLQAYTVPKTMKEQRGRKKHKETIMLWNSNCENAHVTMGEL